MSWYRDLTEPIIDKPTIQVEAPEGFNESHKSNRSPLVKPQAQIDSIKVSKAWDIATGPAKGIPVNLFMMYMSGNSLQMISITMVVTLFVGAFKGIFSVNTAFNGLENKNTSYDVLMAKAVFVLSQFLVIGLGLYKLNSMGLIPNKPGDWLSWETITTYTNSEI